jgi:RHS repeat-associated protein
LARARLVLACTNSASGTCTSPATAVAYSYDPVGRTKDFWQCNPSNCGSSSIWSTQYTYDLAGDIQSWVHPAGYTLTNTVNSAQQVTAVQSSWQDSSHPQYLAQSISYTPWGAVSQLENGCVGSGCTNAQETYQYTKRLQPWVISLAAASGAGSCLVYNYYSGWTPPTSCPSPGSAAPTGTTNNGNVMGYWYQDSVNSSFSHTATYGPDGVNRLSTATATGNSTYNLTFKYDAYGNMACVQNGSTNGPCPQWTYNASTNQLTTSPCTYDAAGNLTKDCSTASNHTYQWDAEGRVSSVDPANHPPTWTFTYNALGERVQMAGPGGTQELMYDPNGVWLGIYGVLDFLPWGGGYFALYNGTDTYFNHINNLSSTSMLTNHAGTAVEDVLFYPWGQNTWRSWGSGGYSFAELPYYDTTTETNLTLFRLQSPGLGRWLSPDPLGGDVTNPQTLNRYAYALNNPTSFTDPLGLQPGGCDSLSDPDCPCDLSDPTCDPTPLPCNPEVDPWDCQWQPPPAGPGGGSGGSTGGSAGNPPSNNWSLGTDCLKSDVIAAIEAELLGLFKSAFGTTLHCGDPGVACTVSNGGTVTLTVGPAPEASAIPVNQIPSSTGTPILHPYDNEIRPKASVPNAPGDYGHLMWNLGKEANTISGAQAHMDIGTFSITHPGALGRHALRAVFEVLQGQVGPGCAQKFADFGIF